MTINVGLVTSEALIFGCDSIASTFEYRVNPSKLKHALNEDGEPILDADGNTLYPVKYEDWQREVSTAWGGVTKMFLIYSTFDDTKPKN